MQNTEHCIWSFCPTVSLSHISSYILLYCFRKQKYLLFIRLWYFVEKGKIKMKYIEGLLSAPVRQTHSRSYLFELHKKLKEQERSLADRIRELKHDIIFGSVEPCEAYNTNLVRPEIIESWIRSKKCGLEIDDFDPAPTLDSSSLTSLMSKKAPILKAADLYIEKLNKIILPSDKYSIFCSDENGIILRVVCSKDELTGRTAERIGLMPGAIWTEATVGTCSHVLCTLIKEPVQLWGPEHYTEIFWEGLTCSTAPIFDSQGKLVGTLSIGSNHYFRQNTHTLGLAIATTWAIQNHLQLIAENDIENDVQNANVIVILNEKRVITHFNEQAQKVIFKGREYREILGQCIDSIIGHQTVINKVLCDGKPLHNAVIQPIETDKEPLYGDILPFKDSYGRVKGCILLLKGIRKEKKHVKSFCFVNKDDVTFDAIVGNSKQMVKAINIAKRVALSNDSILLQGETGTGKDLFARCIHNLSRPNGPFIAVNCAAIPESLAESEFFGYEGGSFTGADRSGRPGKIELANGGTLFLDEIGDMPLEIQAILLRVLEEKRVMRIGGRRYITVDFRLIAATNRDLLELVNNSKFRLDLYYRISTFKIDIPPLRERGLDIIDLVNYFIAAIAREKKINPPSLDERVKEKLLSYSWPGNVRQLENVIRYAVNMCENGIIRLVDLPEEILAENEVLSTNDLLKENGSGTGMIPEKQGDFDCDKKTFPTMREFERDIIRAALKHTNGNVYKAAEILGLGKTTLYRKIKKYDL